MQKIAKPGEAPNYRPAENSNASCQTCFYFGKYANGSGYCNQYKFSAREAFTCDGFTPSAQKSASVVEDGEFLGGKYESKEAHITLLTGSSGSGKSTLADKLKDNYDLVVGTDTGGVVNGKYVALPKEQQQKLRQERTEAILAAHRQGKRVLVEGYPEGQFKHPGVVQHAERVLFLDTPHIRGVLDVARRSFQRGTPLLPDLKMAIETRIADRKPLKLLEQQVGKDNFIRIRRDYAEKKATTPAHIFVTGHSGAGKTTKAHELAKQTGMPILALDDTPEISDYHRRQKAYSKRTGQFEMMADAEKEALSTVMKRIAALKEPHIVEGAHFLAAPHMLPHDAHVVLVDRPKEQILQQRVEREEEKRRLAGKPSDPDGTRTRGEMLHDYYAPGFAVVAARPMTKKAAISGSKEDVRSGKKVDAFFLSAEPKKKWDEFKENVERRSFVQRILADPRTDQKLLAHADSMNRLATGQRLGMVPGANGETYEIKRLRGSGELGCTCADWRYKKSVAPPGERECKHIRMFQGG